MVLLQSLSDTPDLVNQSAMGDGWFIKVKVSCKGIYTHINIRGDTGLLTIN